MGFNVTVDPKNYPEMILHVNNTPISIHTCYAELLALQNLISERLADFKKLQEKERIEKK